MPVQIQGNSYVKVDERIEEFHKLYPNGSIITSLQTTNEQNCYIIKASVYPDIDNLNRVFTGYAHEIIGASFINKTSALENCETSAVGRALGFLNIGLMGSIASADEVENAIHQQKMMSVTDEQKEKYQKLLSDKHFKGKKQATNDWWAGIYNTANPKEAADKCLETMEKAIELNNNPKIKKQKEVA